MRRIGIGFFAAACALCATACGSPSNLGIMASGPATTDGGSCYIGGCVTSTTVPPASSSTTTPQAGVVTGQWTPATSNLAGLPAQCGGVTLVSAAPSQALVVTGVSNQGLWSSTGGTGAWTRLGQGPGSAVIGNRPSSITYDPVHPGTFWESGIYGSGAYETVNGGITFSPLGDLTHSDLVSVDLSDPSRRTLLSGRHEASALFRSVDGGSTWTDLSSTLPAGVGYTIAPLVISPEVFLLGTRNGTSSGIYRSINGGATWSKVYPAGVAGPPLVTSGGAIYWILDGGQGLVESTDQGGTWQYVAQISSSSGNLVELPNGWLAGVGQWVTVSENGGTNWIAIGPPLPYVASGFTYSPSQKSFYAWQSTCTLSGSVTVQPDAIMKLAANLP
jgi:hypothetical protein